ncbi:MAG TPA: hypothetical protein VGR27_10015 [Longimicrobiaceae bacterium]|nr:hypothetical protein [Longimicrobiaceae bacterium]
MAQLNDLSREYEARRFPQAQRLDVHGEGPEAARQRALQWIQSHAHEAPGSELLLVVERGRMRRASPVRQAVEKLLGELTGGLIEWWQPFGPGSLVVRISLDPRLRRLPVAKVPVRGDEGRTPETANPAGLAPDRDIPPELLPLARRTAELRRTREGLAVSLLELVLRRIWIEAQAAAMSERISFEDALQRIRAREEALAYADE